jgi:hypothetical protein
MRLVSQADERPRNGACLGDGHSDLVEAPDRPRRRRSHLAGFSKGRRKCRGQTALTEYRPPAAR